MEEDRGKVLAEARAWCVGTLIATALIVYGAWNNARHNETAARESHGTEQVAPAGAGARQTP